MRYSFYIVLFLWASVCYSQLESAPGLFGPRNQIGSISFDFSGQPVSKGKSFFNGLGEGTQNLGWDVLSGRVWASETLYDRLGRPALQTLAAPVNGGLEYSPDFILTGSGTSYGHSQFDVGGSIDNPSPVGISSELGAFYSSGNPNPYQDVTSYPFVRAVYSRLNPGSVKKVLGGNKVAGEWKQSYSFSMPVGTELEVIPAIGSFLEPGTQVTKTVSRDVNGEDVIIFTDSDGNVVASARNVEDNFDFKYHTEISLGPQGYVDIHIPKGTGSFTIVNPDPELSGPLNVFNLVTEVQIGTINGPTMTYPVPDGFYRIAVTNKADYAMAPSAITVRNEVRYIDFALNYYDKAGRLERTRQPMFAEVLESEFSYNSLGQLLETTDPDEGESRFRYRKDGQIRFSQNSEQEARDAFSYTHYDKQGRPLESGVYEGPIDFSMADVDAADGLDDQYCKEVHYTAYDIPDPDLEEVLGMANCYHLSNEYRQQFVAGNVVKTHTASPHTSTTWYGYDVHGRVVWTLQHIAGLSCPKTIDYTYDPITGQIVSVDYQRHISSERFLHRYEYNIAGQLVKVFTSRTGQDNDWMEQAYYFYAESGELIRTVLNEDLQGIDYIYNLNGYLKAINHPSLLPSNDPGADGTGGSVVAADVFGFAIDYYNGDYARVSTPTPVAQENPHGTDQYNGNIKGVRFNTSGFSPGGGNFQSYMYQYNQNNWLRSANYGIGSISPQGNGHKVNFIPDANGDYGVSSINYDSNGNILSLHRKGYTDGAGNNSMDHFQYYYEGNQLQYIRDLGDNVDPNRFDDLKDQDAASAPNYFYNGIGQLVADAEGKAFYEYNAMGLVSRINTFGNGSQGLQIYYLQDFESATNSERNLWSLLSSTVGSIFINYSGTYVPYGGSTSCTDLDDSYRKSLKLELEHNGIAKREYDVIAGVSHTLELDVIADQWGSSQLPVGYTLYVYNVSGIGGIPAPIATASYNTALAYIGGSPGTVCGKFYERHESLTFTPTGNKIRFELKKVTTGGREPIYLDNITLSAQTIPVMDIAYNDRGQRVKKTVYNPANGNISNTFYVRDISGTIMAIYKGGVNGEKVTPPQLREIPFYGAGRLGVCTLASFATVDGGGDVYHYQLTDHLGNVRAIVGKLTNGTPYVVARTDYYPFGMPMPNRNLEGGYRYGYQGEFADKEPELGNGINSFELRLWDARIGRWLTTDPSGQYFSPYLGMGNNPVSIVDPDGGYNCKNPPCNEGEATIFNFLTGEYEVDLSTGFTLDEVVVVGQGGGGNLYYLNAHNYYVPTKNPAIGSPLPIGINKNSFLVLHYKDDGNLYHSNKGGLLGQQQYNSAEESFFDAFQENIPIAPPGGQQVISSVLRAQTKRTVIKQVEKTIVQVQNRVVNVSKNSSAIWKKLSNAGNGRKTSGSGRDKKYYEWDNTHNDIEVYDRRGNHLGSMDPTTGTMYKDAVKGRYITL